MSTTEKLTTYQVDFLDSKTGAVSAIDTIKKPEGYTAADYVSDCMKNADQAWCDMLNSGEVSLLVIDA